MPVHKAERLLNLIVMLLEASRPVTPELIHQTIPGYGQDNWETFKRMFERDKEELREMGIPLERTAVDLWEQEEGYRIPKERYYLPDVKLEPDEVAALWLAAGLVRLNDPGTARAALLKLSHDSPAGGSEELSWLSADLGLASPNLPVAFQAVTERKQLVFKYRSRSGQKTRTVDPYGLSHRRGAWYLTGLDHLSGELRSFRLDRVAGDLRFVNPTGRGGEFDPPSEFSPDSLQLPPFVQGGPGVAARIRFAPEAAWWVRRSYPWMHIETQQDGSGVAQMEVTDGPGFVAWVLGFAEGAEILEPRELRAAAGERLARICA